MWWRVYTNQCSAKVKLNKNIKIVLIFQDGENILISTSGKLESGEEKFDIDLELVSLLHSCYALRNTEWAAKTGERQECWTILENCQHPLIPSGLHTNNHWRTINCLFLPMFPGVGQFLFWYLYIKVQCISLSGISLNITIFTIKHYLYKEKHLLVQIIL